MRLRDLSSSGISTVSSEVFEGMTPQNTELPDARRLFSAGRCMPLRECRETEASSERKSGVTDPRT